RIGSLGSRYRTTNTSVNAAQSTNSPCRSRPPRNRSQSRTVVADTGPRIIFSSFPSRHSASVLEPRVVQRQLCARLPSQPAEGAGVCVRHRLLVEQDHQRVLGDVAGGVVDGDLTVLRTRGGGLLLEIGVELGGPQPQRVVALGGEVHGQ